jgi:uncharacterized protein (DUF433 family)
VERTKKDPNATRDLSGLIEMRAGAAKIARPCIAGTRIRVSILIDLYKQALALGVSPEDARAELIERYDQLSAAEIDAALAYWRKHTDEIEREILQDEAIYATLEAQKRSLMELLKPR